ncbi:MAG TPA: hypothetical protein VHE34_22275 [Puia sp.]|uniref:hypothetical protein n=1 Tax=Puia sp. TaxID=2045100 RepID=UPI002D0A151C|nr:hypothetical protein [Puia sp.]HVU97974.1 hypothetical protein [Puia sp.]
MEVLQLVGHFQKWNLDAHFQNSIGDGFIFCAYSFPHGFFEVEKINGYNTRQILETSMMDLQFFAKKEAKNINKGKLGTYDFHPAANDDDGSQTNVWIEGLIKRAIKYQIEVLCLKDVIIPNYYENNDLDQFIRMVKILNHWLKSYKKAGVRYFMTLPITHHTVIDDNKIDLLLYHLTDIDIIFDGYYIICESKPEGIQKISTDFKYLNNLYTVLSLLKKQKFTTIYSYANWDAAVFLALTDIDYITIGTYENLRNFNIKRFTVNDDGGPSKGFYFSEKLLNFIKSPLLNLIRMQKGIELIRNADNIFSDVILQDGYPWSNQKPEVHKNYLLAVDRILKELASIENVKERTKAMIQKIDNAIATYHELEKKGIYLTSESRNYHLDTWKSFLLSKS